MQYIINLFPSEAIHQGILLYNNLVIAQVINTLLYNKVFKPTLLLVLRQTWQFLLDTLRWEISELYNSS